MAKGDTTATTAAEAPEEQEETGPFNCDKCEAIFSNAQQLMSHKIHGHPKAKAEETTTTTKK
jgi:hypothetical protein